ncbi:MAG: hypothetical protein U0132_08630 [Gemmatimonadaceae bacterium]
MHEERQDRWIEEQAGQLYRPSEHPPLQPMWDEIDARLTAGVRPARSRWFVTRSLWLGVFAAAACLVIGFELGQRRPIAVAQPAATMAAAVRDSLDAPYDHAATTLLGETAVLLRALPASRTNVVASERFASQATELLGTTRLLLDSPAATDPRLRELLQDLELVLAQVASLHNGKNQTDIELIRQALSERDIVPRIRRVAAELATGGN